MPTRHASSLGTAQWQGCGHPDPGHGWDSGRAQLSGGFLDKDSGNDEFALSYYNRGELGFIHEAARQYTLYDRYFMLAAGLDLAQPLLQVVGPVGRQDRTTARRPAPAGNQWETIFDRAIGSGLSARYYASDLPFSAVWGARGVRWTNPIERYYTECAAGTLPQHLDRRPAVPRRRRRGRASRPTSTRSATCAWARRSWPTW